MKLLSISVINILALTLSGQPIWHPPASNPIELGNVSWLRDYNEALQLAKSSNKAIFILFQEVPGCSTCTTYGKNVMSHPLIVEAIEQHFIPLCIYNNKKGRDAEVLKKYKEPTWNNPVVRIVDKNGNNIIDRLASSYSEGYLISGIITSLRQMGKPIPDYLSILEMETSNYAPQEIVLGMYCFWSGEKLMASIPGVTETEAGFMNGKEVVKVTYNPNYISDKDLVNKSKNGSCADVVFDNRRKFSNVSTKKKGSFIKDKESKYYLFKSPYKSIPMTSLQQLKANAELSNGGDITYLLSPRQQQLWKYLQMKNIKENRIGEDIGKAWLSTLAQLDDRL